MNVKAIGQGRSVLASRDCALANIRRCHLSSYCFIVYLQFILRLIPISMLSILRLGRGSKAKPD